MRLFDSKQEFEAIKKSATEAVQSVFPIEGKNRIIKLDGVSIDDNLRIDDYKSQAEMKSKQGTWGVPVYASLSLIDKASGRVINKNNKVRLFILPKATDRFSYIVGGNEYQVNNQLRLKSGVYTVKKQNGELKTMVNLAQGKNFDLVFDEKKGTFAISKIGGGQANIPLYPILSDLGVSDQAMSQSWSPELLAANKTSDPRVMQRATTAFGLREGSLKEYFGKTKLNPEMTKLTLGGEYDKVSGPMLLSAAKKLLEVHLGKEEPQDLNSLEYKELHSLEDFIKERLEKNKTTLSFKIQRSIDNPKRTTISQIVNPEAFNSTIETFFTQDDKSSTPEQTNPLDMLSGQYKATIMGSGGVTSEHAVTDSMREIHPTHYGLLDPIHTPESKRIGANLHLPLGAVKGGKELKAIFTDKKGKPAVLSPTEIYNSKIAFPGEKGERVKVLYKGSPMVVDRKEVDYFSPAPQALFSWSTNLVPYLPSNQGNRAMMAAKMLEQATSLKHREAPLVQVRYGNETLENRIGKSSAVVSPLDGVVTKITDDEITLNTKEGAKVIGLYNNFVLNRKSYLKNEVKVKVGEKVKAGQLLADNNFTKDGTLALGVNLRAAYLPYKGLNFEDGIVITESAAEKLTSTHLHRKEISTDENTILKLNAYRTQYPNVLTPENLRKLDEDGVIKKGQRVKMGEAVIAALRKRDPSKMLQVINKKLSDRPKDESIYWTFEDEGEVIDVQKGSKGVTVFIRTEEKAKIGDKLAGRMGNKGIITKIIPDSEAPRNSKDEPVDILLNPHGVISRINIGQIYESAAAKAAKKQNRVHEVDNFSGEDYLETTKDFVRKAKVDDKEELFDPVSGKKLGRVHVGNPYILKLFKLSQGNFSARQGGPGNPYDLNLQPLKVGGEESSKALDLLTMYSMLSHGARANLREMTNLKASQNDEFWTALKSGQPLPPPKSPFVYDKFLAYLKGAGIDVKKDGTKLTLAPLTDSEVTSASSGEVENPNFFYAKNMAPIKGGFLDPVKFGGFKGTKWGHIELKEAIVNPVFENAVKKITGLGSQFEEIMAGKLYVDKSGNLNAEGKGVTGGAAIEILLKKIDVDEQIKVLTLKAKTSKGTALDDLNKRIRYLTALKKYDLKPEEAYLRKKVPVVPPVFRPIYTLPDGNTAASDVNYIYQNLAVLNKMQNLPVMDMLPEEEKSVIRKDIYQHAKGLSGITDLNIKGRERAGFISDIKGGGAEGQPKEGFFISKLLSKQQDFAGRGTIIPEPELGVDEVALPEQMAWRLFEPFVIKELGRLGKTPNAAMQEIEKRTELAKKALEIVMQQRKVLLNRAPSLHKFSIMAFKPKTTSGTAIKIPPLVVKGFNADFDGDQQYDFVPVTLSKECQLCFNAEYLEERRVASRFKETIPCQTDGDVFLFHLEDFPHGGLVASKKGEKGRIDFHAALPGTKVLSYDEKTQRVEWKEISHWSKHYDREVVTVNLQSGLQIFTDDDPRAVYGIEKGTLSFSRATPKEAIEKGMLVPRASILDLEGDKKEIEVPQRDRGNRAHLLNKRIALDGLLGYFVGTVAGDGWCSDERQVYIAGITEEILKKTDQAVAAIHKTSPARYTTENQSSYGKSKKHAYSSAALCELIEPWVGSQTKNKHLPPFFLSACKEFREGLFAGLMDTDGSISVFNAKDKPQLISSFSSTSLRLAQEVQLLAASLGIKGRISASKTPAEKDSWVLSFSSADIKKWNGKEMVHPEKLNKLAIAEVSENSAVSAKYDVIPISTSLAETIRKNLGAPSDASPEQKSLYAVLHKAAETGTISRQTAKKLPGFVFVDILNHPDGKTWLAIVEDTRVQWESVESIDVTGIKETGYDLTVPGYETFMNVSGVILSNTMTVHVPITEDANQEAEKLLPSRNLYQPGTGKLMITPSQEAQIGLYYLSKTPQGRARINQIVGKQAVGGVLNKKATQELLLKLSKELKSNEFGRVLTDLKSEGEKIAFERGFTLGLDDLSVMKKERDKVVTTIRALLPKTTQEQLPKLNAKATELVDKILSKRFKDKNNPLYDMVESGARGEPSQLRQILATPLFVADAKGKIVPSVIQKSYAEGLDVGDYWTSMYGARRGMMDRAIQTSLPGAFSKDIMANTIDTVISDTDCGTTRGVSQNIDSPDVLDRYAAGDSYVSRNVLIDSDEVSRLRKKGVKTILVRSPLTCLKPKGVCSKCYGLDEHGQAPEVGENVGAKAGQTISEPLVQLVMNTFHTGGAAGTGADVQGYKRIDQLLKLPKAVPGAASLAPIPGKITKIQRGIAGGFDVFVGDKKVHTPQGKALKVKIGDEVSAGDALSEGVIKPQDLVQLKGMQPAQEYIVNELHGAYANQGVKIHRKVFETIIRSFGNTTKVINNPKQSYFVPGDVVPYTVAQHYNENLNEEVPTENAVGYVLSKNYGLLRAGHEVTQKDTILLKALGHKKVLIKKEALQHAPLLKSVTTLPLLKRNWMSALGYRNLAKALTEGAGQGWSTDLEDYHPIPAFAHSTTFGKGKDGKY